MSQPRPEPVIASPLTRLVAMVYDGMLILALLFLMGTVLTVVGTYLTMEAGQYQEQAQELPKWYQDFVLTPSFFVTLWLFYAIFWRRAGQTLGMQTWRLKTVTYSGQLLSWPQTVLRMLCACLLPAVCALIGLLFYGSRNAMFFSAGLGMLFNYGFGWFNRRGLCIHDWLSNTVTLKMPKVVHPSLLARWRNRRLNAGKQ